MNKRYLKILKKIALILLGNTIYALAVTMFILPNGLITGGTTGLALIFNHQFGLPITVFVSVFNISMFILGALVLGKAFALTTLISTFYYPFILGILQKISPLQHMTSDHLLSTIYAGLMIGFSIGIVIKAGASTGGMDIPPLVLNKKFGLSVSVVMYGFDFTILISQMLFANKEQVLYGLLLVLIYTVVLDKVLLLGKSRTQVKIVSDKYEEINQMIIRNLDRGSTLIQAETGYFHNDNLVVLTVISNRELPKLNELVLAIDPKAFMIISRVNEVKGRGFTMDKSYAPASENIGK
ncbi:YitT family protein [Inconstantimicrobium mannanitabidum]|uniref:Membrane protein n=1 Tax=Inconstantimicrobium mannanitabidum TaxID=1604901 RepID=A0ACB5RDT7_9CLOT|nr:YitT family protein [Clostridium sp. TW13]GKX67198.1 membrane protein [Clostridium sp. TW13]